MFASKGVICYNKMNIDRGGTQNGIIDKGKLFGRGNRA